MSKSHKVTPAEMKTIAGEVDDTVDSDATERIEDVLELIRVGVAEVEDGLDRVAQVVCRIAALLTVLGGVGLIVGACELWTRFR